MCEGDERAKRCDVRVCQRNVCLSGDYRLGHVSRNRMPVLCTLSDLPARAPVLNPLRTRSSSSPPGSSSCCTAHPSMCGSLGEDRFFSHTLALANTDYYFYFAVSEIKNRLPNSYSKKANEDHSGGMRSEERVL